MLHPNTHTGRVIDLARPHTQSCHWASGIQSGQLTQPVVFQTFNRLWAFANLCLTSHPTIKRVQIDGQIPEDLAVKRLPTYCWENGPEEGPDSQDTPNSGLEPQARWTGVDTAPWAGTALGRTCMLHLVAIVMHRQVQESKERICFHLGALHLPLAFWQNGRGELLHQSRPLPCLFGSSAPGHEDAWPVFAGLAILSRAVGLQVLYLAGSC